MAKFDAVARELRAIYKANGHRLHPQDVIEAAKDPDSPIHGKFCWDDTEAAHQFRLWQARQLIATVRISIPASKGSTTIVRAYHNLRSERNGYRHTSDIMSNAGLRSALLEQLAADLERIKDTYESLRRVSAAKKVLSVIEEFCKKRTEAVA